MAINRQQAYLKAQLKKRRAIPTKAAADIKKYAAAKHPGVGVGVEKQPVPPAPAREALRGSRGGGRLNRVYSGKKIEKYGKAFEKSQKLAPPANIQPGAVPTGQEHKMRHAFKESVAKRHKLNRKLITARYGKSGDWHKKIYGPGYKEGTVGRLGTKAQAQRAHIYGQKASIYKLGKKLKKYEAEHKPKEGEEAAEPSDRAKALQKRIDQLTKNVGVSKKNLGTTKAEKQKYLDKRDKMLKHLYTLARSKPGSLRQARKAEAEGRLKSARYRAPGHAIPKGERGHSGKLKKPPRGAQGKTDKGRHPGGPPGMAVRHRIKGDPAKTRRYWTKWRMQHAKPIRTPKSVRDRGIRYA